MSREPDQVLTMQADSPVTVLQPHVGAENIEALLADVLAGLVGAETISVDSHFFDDLGADSMVMAHFCAKVRKRGDLPSVSMKDIYRHTTVRQLAAALADDVPAPVTPAPAPTTVGAVPVSGSTALSGAATASGPAPTQGTAAPGTDAAPTGAGNRLEYALCGVLQLLVFLEYSCLAALVLVQVYEWVSAAPGVLGVYERSVVSGMATFVMLFTLPILAKWVLIGRWRPQVIRAWSLEYVRFWVVRTLVQRNLLVFLFAGSPLYTLYLRALGAKVGRGVTIFSLNVPACTDLLTVGSGTVVRKDAFINCFRADAGTIRTGPVSLGDDVFVGEVTVLDIDTSMGDGAQLGHSSALQAGQTVPAGECWHGTPAQPAEVDYRTVDPRPCGAGRRGAYVLLQLVTLFAVYLPLGIGGMIVALRKVPVLQALDPETELASGWAFLRDGVEASSVLYFGALLVGLLVAVSVPRVLNLFVKPDTTYPLYGVHYSLHRTIARMTNIKIYLTLFGDSSYIVNYLQWIGYDLCEVRQTGSNFGQAVKHENPYLSVVGSGTMVADGLSIMNADFSSTSFRTSRTSIGANSFLGNRIAYPSQARIGDNCLLATKVMVPIDGPVREGVGLLGSPSFEIPRTVDRDSGFDLESEEELRRLLGAKNRHNLVTLALTLLVRWGYVLGLTLVYSGAIHLYPSAGVGSIALANVMVLLYSVVLFVLVERAVSRLQAHRPRGCSIYDRAFWRHERYWKVNSTAYLLAFNGTPFKGMIWRLLGVRVGRRVFDDGCSVTERGFATIGDECTLNAGSILQCHSQEDGAFKSDRITLGAGCTVGVGALVHYGVTMGDGAQLAVDSFLMKGEDVPAGARWGGNPAREMRETAPQPRAVPERDRPAAVLTGRSPHANGHVPDGDRAEYPVSARTAPAHTVPGMTTPAHTAPALTTSATTTRGGSRC